MSNFLKAPRGARSVPGTIIEYDLETSYSSKRRTLFRTVFFFNTEIYYFFTLGRTRGVTRRVTWGHGARSTKTTVIFPRNSASAPRHWRNTCDSANVPYTIRRRPADARRTTVLKYYGLWCFYVRAERFYFFAVS